MNTLVNNAHYSYSSIGAYTYPLFDVFELLPSAVERKFWSKY